MVFTQSQLKILIARRCEATGISTGTLSNLIFGESNRKALTRLLAGYGISATSAERTSAWLLDNWLPETPWPSDIPRPRRRRPPTARRQAEECSR